MVVRESRFQRKPFHRRPLRRKIRKRKYQVELENFGKFKGFFL